MTKVEVALIAGGGPGISASCARLFSAQGMKVVVVARNTDKPVLQNLRDKDGVSLYACDVSDPSAVSSLFQSVKNDLGIPRLVVHNIDGRTANIFRKGIHEAEPEDVLATIRNSAFSAFLVGQQAAKYMLAADDDHTGKKGTILYTNASAASKGYAKSGAFAIACQGKKGLAESMARELGPKGIHIAQIPIDAAIGWTQEDGTRRHWAAGASVDDNMADPDYIAETYLQLHKQHRSTWAFEVTLRPWVEKW